MAQATSATYSACPDTVPIDAVRLLVGDTNCTAALLLDSEIQYFLDQAGGNVQGGAVGAARAIAAKFAQSVTVTTGKVSKQFSDRVKQYESLATRLEADFSASATPWAGGISRAEKEAASASTANVQPTFERGQFDNPRSDDPSQPF